MESRPTALAHGTVHRPVQMLPTARAGARTLTTTVILSLLWCVMPLHVHYGVANGIFSL
jgi:hypothetical protein